jgi:bacteriocin biosynthesis cyclodehydratase domain-containing protein
MRPTLLPNLRRLWRDAQTLQLGSDPDHAVVIRLSRPAASRALDLLDGSATTSGLLAGAAQLGVSELDVEEIVDLLRRLGLVLGAHELTPSALPEGVRRRLRIEAAAIALRRRVGLQIPTGARTRQSAERGQVTTLPERADTQAQSSAKITHSPTPAEILRRRADACVLIAGDGPLVAPVAAALAAAGVGHIAPALDGVIRPGDIMVGGFGADDVRRSRAVANADAVTRAAPGTDLSAARSKRAAFVVQFGARPSATLGARGIRLRHLPVLEVGIRLGTVVIGPLVRPRASPCRNCLELHRKDRDPAWPVLMAQLATAPSGEEEPCAQTTALAGAAYAADEVLAYLDGAQPRTEAAIVEIARPGEARRRAWAAHPRCACRRRSSR